MVALKSSMIVSGMNPIPFRCLEGYAFIPKNGPIYKNYFFQRIYFSFQEGQAANDWHRAIPFFLFPEGS
jgi:hypothetical protein